MFKRNRELQTRTAEARPSQVKSVGTELGEAILRQARIAAALHLALSARRTQRKD
ncbi:MAG: hypothetical protein VX908_07050 [Planctomycetota bacterium]|nr:hypothetical protein [Planctomycetota bacterium]